MKRFTSFAFGLFIAVAIGAAAQDSVIPSKLRLQSLGVNAPAPARGSIVATADTGATTPMRANGNGTNDVEILANSPAGGDAYFRATAISATNWSAGVRRSTNNYVIANGVGLATPVASLSTAGVLNLAAGGSYQVNGVTVGTDASNITAGTLAVARGGTNLTASANDATMVGNGTTWVSTAIPSCSATTSALRYNTTTNAFSCDTLAVHARSGRVNIVSNVSCNVSDTQFDTTNSTPSATGVCTYGWGTAFTINPLCTVSPIIASRIAFVSARTTTSVTVNLTDLAGTPQNGSVDVTCIGF